MQIKPTCITCKLNLHLLSNFILSLLTLFVCLINTFLLPFMYYNSRHDDLYVHLQLTYYFLEASPIYSYCLPECKVCWCTLEVLVGQHLPTNNLMGSNLHALLLFTLVVRKCAALPFLWVTRHKLYTFITFFIVL